MKRIAILLSACVVALALFGCAAGQTAGSSSQASSASASETPPSSASATNDAKPKGEPWVSANVLGVVTEDTQANVREDYYVAGFKNWLSTVKIPAGESSWGAYAERQHQIYDQLLTLIDDKSITDHDVTCMRNYFGLLSNWDARNAAGIEPVMEDVRKVQAISSISELTSYLLSDSVRLNGNYIADDEGAPQGETLITFGLTIPQAGTTDYLVDVGTNSRFTQSANGYGTSQDLNSELNKPFVLKASYMLEHAGYSNADAQKMMSLVANLESELEKAMQPTEDEQRAAEEYYEKALSGAGDLSEDEWEVIMENMYAFYDHTTRMTRDEMAACSGSFPILQLLDAYGLGDAASYAVAEPIWLSTMGQMYTEQNLEALKAHIICGLLIDAMPYLDYDTAAVGAMGDYLSLSTQSQAESYGDASGESGSQGSSESGAASQITEADDEVPANRVEPVDSKQQDRELTMATLQQDMPGVVTNAYVAHCYPESVNNRALEITRQIITEYRNLINGEDWLDPATRAAAIEKLDAMEIHVGYPSSLDDTAELQVPAPGSGASLYDASKALDAYNVELTQKLLVDPSEGAYWQNPMEVNAFYSTADNAIFVGCGIIGGKLFDENGSVEEQLATLGTTIGHEISHAFDSSGASFDKDGNYRNWWTSGDLIELKERTNKVVNYLSTIKPFGDEPYDGKSVCAETISDIGGLKAALMVGRSIQGFDNKKFFDAYLMGWQSVGTLSTEKNLFYTDPHPLDATRANVSAMQVQEFYDAYGIQPGDKMYLAPEDRIAIW